MAHPNYANVQAFGGARTCGDAKATKHEFTCCYSKRLYFVFIFILKANILKHSLEALLTFSKLVCPPVSIAYMRSLPPNPAGMMQMQNLLLDIMKITRPCFDFLFQLL